jgi:hypothetical protein
MFSEVNFSSTFLLLGIVMSITYVYIDKFLKLSPAVLAVWRWPLLLFWAVFIVLAGVFLALVYRPAVTYCRR